MMMMQPLSKAAGDGYGAGVGAHVGGWSVVLGRKSGILMAGYLCVISMHTRRGAPALRLIVLAREWNGMGKGDLPGHPGWRPLQYQARPKWLALALLARLCRSWIGALRDWCAHTGAQSSIKIKSQSTFDINLFKRATSSFQTAQTHRKMWVGGSNEIRRPSHSANVTTWP